ncbi:hypothetical protein RFI_20602 [Reticulomyxa filosa]|uniref:Uncharacterized protein n=2 Tax=Reticulomyxa filosa TaxID=46433 RepID=X6MST2_RETFI|nr:hypothetical protein RFI_20602 [Reticulomyxa filosa]|eukprot:ETO16736.1 hypothetical protein RFI_20602 [Reticulomyxa filosa]
MTTEPTKQNKKCQLEKLPTVVFTFTKRSNIVVNQKTTIKLSRDLQKNIGKTYEQLLKMMHTSKSQRLTSWSCALTEIVQGIVQNINAGSDKHIICRVSDSKYKMKKVFVKGIGHEEDIDNIKPVRLKKIN